MPKKSKPQTTLKPATSLAEQIEILSGRGWGMPVKAVTLTDELNACMSDAVRKRLEAAGWTVGTADEFLGIAQITIDGTVYDVTIDQKDDGRWIAGVAQLPGVMAYGATQTEALKAVEAIIRASASPSTP